MNVDVSRFMYFYIFLSARSMRALIHLAFCRHHHHHSPFCSIVQIQSYYSIYSVTSVTSVISLSLASALHQITNSTTLIASALVLKFSAFLFLHFDIDSEDLLLSLICFPHCTLFSINYLQNIMTSCDRPKFYLLILFLLFLTSI